MFTNLRFIDTITCNRLVEILLVEFLIITAIDGLYNSSTTEAVVFLAHGTYVCDLLSRLQKHSELYDIILCHSCRYIQLWPTQTIPLLEITSLISLRHAALNSSKRLL